MRSQIEAMLYLVRIKPNQFKLKVCQYHESIVLQLLDFGSLFWSVRLTGGVK
jgi:hypothetical protein